MRNWISEWLEGDSKASENLVQRRGRNVAERRTGERDRWLAQLMQQGVERSKRVVVVAVVAERVLVVIVVVVIAVIVVEHAERWGLQSMEMQRATSYAVGYAWGRICKGPAAADDVKLESWGLFCLCVGPWHSYGSGETRLEQGEEQEQSTCCYPVGS